MSTRFAFCGALTVSLALAACGGSTTTTVVHREAPAPKVDVNQKTADGYADLKAGAIMAQICQDSVAVGRPVEAKVLVKVLGRQIVRSGGDPLIVVGLMLDKCGPLV